MSAAHAQHVGLLLVRTGHAAHTLALLRRVAMTLLQHESTTRCGIKAKRLRPAGITATCSRSLPADLDAIALMSPWVVV